MVDEIDRERATGEGELATSDEALARAPTEEKRGDGQHKDHWVLSEEERRRGFVRPVRGSYVHADGIEDSGEGRPGCGAETTMGRAIAETYARDPGYYGSTFCVKCKDYFPVRQFRWDDGSVVGS